MGDCPLGGGLVVVAGFGLTLTLYASTSGHWQRPKTVRQKSVLVLVPTVIPRRLCAIIGPSSATEPLLFPVSDQIMSRFAFFLLLRLRGSCHSTPIAAQTHQTSSSSIPAASQTEVMVSTKASSPSAAIPFRTTSKALSCHVSQHTLHLQALLDITSQLSQVKASSISSNIVDTRSRFAMDLTAETVVEEYATVKMGSNANANSGMFDNFIASDYSKQKGILKSVYRNMYLSIDENRPKRGKMTL